MFSIGPGGAGHFLKQIVKLKTGKRMETTALSTGSIVGISILVLICLVYAGIGIAMFLKHRREEQESDYVKRMDDDDYHNNLFL